MAQLQQVKEPSIEERIEALMQKCVEGRMDIYRLQKQVDQQQSQTTKETN